MRAKNRCKRGLEEGEMGESGPRSNRRPTALLDIYQPKMIVKPFIFRVHNKGWRSAVPKGGEKTIEKGTEKTGLRMDEPRGRRREF